MEQSTGGRFGRRTFARLAAGGALALMAGPALAATEEEALHDYVPNSQDTTPRLLRRVSGLKTRRWQDYFGSVSMDCILCDIRDRVLHYWGSDGFYRIYPTSVPLTEEMTRRGRTSITLKRPDPDWRPTAGDALAQPGAAGLRARPAPTIRSESARSTWGGRPTASTAPTTSARSAASRRRAASGCSTSTSSRSTTAPRSGRRCC